jgi:hypothetical protein
MGDEHTSKVIEVTFYQRRPRPGANFSLEFIFNDVRRRLDGKITSKTRIAPFVSNGLFRRLAICIDAWLHQSGVNHVTGDINFAAIALKPSTTVLTILD